MALFSLPNLNWVPSCTHTCIHIIHKMSRYLPWLIRCSVMMIDLMDYNFYICTSFHVFLLERMTRNSPNTFYSSQITEDGDCSHEIKRCLLLGRKVMTNLDSILKSRDITLPTEVRLVKAMVFPVVMYECENWTVKKAERWRIDAFELWCWRRLLRVP